MTVDLPRNLTTQDVAEIFDVESSTARRWALDGCPADKSSGVWKFNEAEVQAWLDETGRTGDLGRPRKGGSETLDEARLRKELALARKYELANARDEGELLVASDVQRRIVSMATVTCTRLMQVPEEVAPRCVGRTVEEIEQEIRERIRQALNRLADHGASEASEAFDGDSSPVL